MLVALVVADPVAYARYREAMAPILAAHGGSFRHDFVVAEVLRGVDPGSNRVFTLVFPDRAAKQRFFADERYREVRAVHFEPAVVHTEIVAEFTLPPASVWQIDPDRPASRRRYGEAGMAELADGFDVG
ncbi:DUF1330 domain-containing protein [Nannocystis sp. SCPEA4]|uniref:DUF1330 domain-containing protein n=1 Tax=Nannocystis sp. SCPEA4 TaxID=2996787 RepID=UPI002271C66F|nr:DUF1330 domain-containing protein [Nannocystis sp. SCPEA4]MCY1062755.1 DUF1330 domain-containing protein [Nannocystis sp. SCPEA4]